MSIRWFLIRKKEKLKRKKICNKIFSFQECFSSLDKFLISIFLDTYPIQKFCSPFSSYFFITNQLTSACTYYLSEFGIENYILATNKNRRPLAVDICIHICIHYFFLFIELYNQFSQWEFSVIFSAVYVHIWHIYYIQLSHIWQWPLLCNMHVNI